MITSIHKKLAGLALVAGLAAFGVASTANAQLITLKTGNFTIHANGYSSDTLPPATSAPGGMTSSIGGIEDTWGIFQVNSIDTLTPSLSNVFSENKGTEYWGVFYNSVDQTTTPLGGGSASFTAQGLKLDIYKVTVNDTNDVAFNKVVDQGIAGRTSISGFNGITNAGSLVLSSELTSGTSMTSFFTAPNHTSAFGSLTVTSDNMFDVGLGNLSNLSFSLAGLTTQVPADWTVKFGGPIDGSVFTPVPEPTAFAAMGAALLLGVVALRRRSRQNLVALPA